MDVVCLNCNNILGIPTLTCRKGVIINRKVCLAGEDVSSPAYNERLLPDTIFVLYVYHPFRYDIEFAVSNIQSCVFCRSVVPVLPTQW